MLPILGQWVLIRSITSLLAASYSSERPFHQIESAIQVWPPSTPFSNWLERVLLSPWLRWDAEWFQRILVDGYRKDNGTALFHPLYPWLAKPLYELGVHPTLSLLLISSIATILLLFFFERLAGYDLSPKQARTATLLFLVFPSSFVLFAPYTEALFLLCTVLCFLCMRQERWWSAGLFGALATLTRQQGLFLVLPFLWSIWEAKGRSLGNAFSKWRDWLSLSLIPIGMGAWLVFRGLALGDFNPDLTSVNSFIYSFFVTPSAAQVVHSQAFLMPWQAVYLAITQVRATNDPDTIVNLIVAAYFLFLLILAWPYLRTSYRLYIAAITLVSFSLHTGPIHPYMGLPRHLMLGFPVFIGLGAVVNRPWQRLSLVVTGASGLLFLTVLYVIHAWVP